MGKASNAACGLTILLPISGDRRRPRKGKDGTPKFTGSGLYEINAYGGTPFVFVDPAPKERMLHGWVKVSFDEAARAKDGTFLMPPFVFEEILIRKVKEC